MARDRKKESQFCSSRPSGSQQFRRVEMVWSRADKGQRKRSSSYGTAVRAIPLLPSSSRSTISCQKANANENENAYVVRDFELGRAIRVRKGRKKKRRRKGGGEQKEEKGRGGGTVADEGSVLERRFRGSRWRPISMAVQQSGVKTYA